MSGPLYTPRVRKPSSLSTEAQRNLQIAKQPKIETENKKRQVAAEALLLLNPSEASKSSVGVPHAVSTGNLDAVTSKMTDVINQLYGENMVKEWKQSAKRPRYGRDIYELSSATTQCMNTIGSPEKAGGCWICGFAFDNDIPYMRPNCDHILPVIQAVFFLGLYSTRKVIPTNKEELKNMIYELEYAWAHAGCNILKSNIVLIKETIDPITKTPKWSVDEENVEKLLTTIKTTKTADLAEIQSKITDPKEWFGTQKGNVIDRVKKITDFISRPEEPGLGNLTVLAGWASLVDPTSMSDDFLNFIDVKLPPNVLSVSRRKRSLSQTSDTEQPQPAKKLKVGATRRRKIRKSRKTYKWRRLL